MDTGYKVERQFKKARFVLARHPNDLLSGEPRRLHLRTSQVQRSGQIVRSTHAGRASQIIG